MEERSPGSYRFAIRGSSIRSPFGVRNVKVYWNNLPLTDAGGNTYLNLLDPESLGRIEIIKGPGGSAYGAGTGGVLLIGQPQNDNSIAQASIVSGSYGLNKQSALVDIVNKNVEANVFLGSHRSDGFRKQSAFDRSSFNGNLQVKLTSKHTVSGSILYTDLVYETPGGLTREQFEEDPEQARPAGNTPGAEEQNAAVFNKTIFGGVTHQAKWRADFQTVTSLYGALSDFSNPSIREFEIRDEKNFGIRSVTQKIYVNDRYKLTLSGGTECQFLDSPIEKYENIGGEKGTVRSTEDLSADMIVGFLQSDLDFRKWIITFGLSANVHMIKFRNMESNESYRKEFEPAFLPRVALLRELGNVSVYTGFSRGFSPPTIADLLPSGGTFNRSLQAEAGNNLELGVRGKLTEKLFFDITAYQFKMKNTIVRRVTADDVEYFLNAGETSQGGLESAVRWEIWKGKGFVNRLSLSGSYAYSRYRFENYVVQSTDISGRKLTGVPPTSAFVGLDSWFAKYFYLNLSMNYVDHIPLDDANSTFARPYYLTGIRAGFYRVNPVGIELYLGVDNVADIRYSLGHDLNAIGGRYYNAAMPRNFYMGLRITIPTTDQ